VYTSFWQVVLLLLTGASYMLLLNTVLVNSAARYEGGPIVAHLESVEEISIRLLSSRLLGILIPEGMLGM